MASNGIFQYRMRDAKLTPWGPRVRIHTTSSGVLMAKAGRGSNMRRWPFSCGSGMTRAGDTELGVTLACAMEATGVLEGGVAGAAAAVVVTLVGVVDGAVEAVAGAADGVGVVTTAGAGAAVG